jgi:cytochrome P450
MAELAYDMRDPEFRRDPYPRYAALRAMEETPRTEDGLFVLTRHADVVSVLRNERMSSDPRHIPEGARRGSMDLPMLSDGTVSLMLTSDAPEHTRLRRLANKAFTPRAVERLRPWVVELVDGMLDEAAERDVADLMALLAEPLPVVVICELLGVPNDDWEQFKPWSTAIARVLDPDADDTTVQAAIPAVVGFVQYFGELIELRRAAPGDDLLSALVHAESDGETLSLGDLFAMIILLFIAGHETTTNLIGNGTFALLRHRDQLDALCADPDGLVVPATEELLRFDSPVQITARTATAPVDVGALHLEPGDRVVCGLAAANRDPAYVEEPERLLLARGVATHVSFGNGMHYCLGAPLARLEGQVVFDRLVRRFPSMALADDRPPYRDHFVLRGLAELPVALRG